MNDWNQQLSKWRASTPLETFAPANLLSIEEARITLEKLPRELEELYRITNGLTAGWFKLLPVEDPADIKRTWDGLRRANDPKSTRFLGRSSDLLDRFIVFADVGAGRAAAFDRDDGSIWYEEEGQLRQTNLSLAEFIDATLREVSEG
jgi:hypothetical protein